MNIMPLTLDSSSTTSAVVMLIVYIGIFAALFYFLSVRPSRKRQRETDAMLASLEVGDSVLTTSGFYGVVIDISDEVVVVEFGSDKHCRIPMQKEAIVSVEKEGSADGE
ncbi:MAG: preprotein translocase subunit YajC [Lachnospiraceae bacterium]|jgi:preprotein translocase subunit YajC